MITILRNGALVRFSCPECGCGFFVVGQSIRMVERIARLHKLRHILGKERYVA